MAQALGLVRLHLRIVDTEGQALHRAFVRTSGTLQQPLSDSAGTISLLVDLANGPFHLVCICLGYSEGLRSIDRPEDNTLIFQLFRSEKTVSSHRTK